MKKLSLVGLIALAVAAQACAAETDDVDAQVDVDVTADTNPLEARDPASGLASGKRQHRPFVVAVDVALTFPEPVEPEPEPAPHPPTDPPH